MNQDNTNPLAEQQERVAEIEKRLIQVERKLKRLRRMYAQECDYLSVLVQAEIEKARAAQK